MADSGPLIVPITVEALVVNDDVRQVQNGDGFVRAQMDYSGAFQTGELDNAEPAPFQNDADFTAQPGSKTGNGIDVSTYYDGVYLKWRLPDALTQGAQDNQAGATTFPLVPNRWMVVRVGGADPTQRQATAWVVQSDYSWTQMPSAQTYGGTASTFMVGSPPAPGLIGQSVQLGASGWSEPGTPMFLTAVGPGSPAFAVYQPYNVNVFSFMDGLNGQPAQVLSYLVIGWYSDPTQDPLAGATQSTFAQVLEDLGWAVPEGVDPTAVMTTSSLYVGQLTNVPWATANAPTATGAPPAQGVQVAVGNSSAEALGTLVAQQASNAGDSDVDASLLEAFQLGLLRSYDQPDAGPLLQQQLLASRFQSTNGGYGWEIVTAPGADTSGLTAAELSREAGLLETLNESQATLDASMQLLAALQQQLYAMWWKYEFWFNANPASKSKSLPLTQDDIAKQLDPSSAGSLAQQVQQQAATVTKNTQAVPWGTTPDQLAASVSTYATQTMQLPASRLLKRYRRPTFQLPNNPVVLLSGAGAQDISAGQAALTCRMAGVSGQLVTGLDYGGTDVTSGVTITAPQTGTLTGVPWAASTLTPLLTEFFFLDPQNAAAIVGAGVLSGPPSVSDVQAAMEDPDANAIGTVPTYGTGDWGGAQPWRPLFLMWAGNYYPIDYGSASAPNWTYGGDGQGFTWNGQGGATEPLGASGTILLTPGALLNLQAQIQQFLTQNPSLAQDEVQAVNDLLAFIQGEAGDEQPGGGAWDFLSQALDGFLDRLLSRMAGAFPAAEMGSVPKVSAATLSSLIGTAPMYPPNLGALPADKPFTTNFQPWLCGQFVFTNLAVVDEWGQAVFLTDPSQYQDLVLAMPPEMTPSQKVISGMPGAVVQVGPGLLQPGRLDFDLVSATDDGDVLGMNAGVNPITGWVLPNHLDHSLMAYDNQGNALGELTAGVGSTSPVWLPSPNSPYASFSAMVQALPHFGPFLQALQSLPLSSFNAFLGAVDETLWASPPVGVSFNTNLSVLVGRPLALARARLMFELNGPPLQDPAWQFTLKPAQSPVPGYAFDIQLGTSTDLSDGLVGYFTADTYTTFNVAPQAGTAAGQDPYLAPIASGNFVSLPFDGKTATYVSMLVDPRASVHASTGLLPNAMAALPPAFVAPALAAMNVAFRLGPMLVDQTTDASGNTTLLVPRPAGNLGAWSWLENDDSGWTSYPLGKPDAAAKLSAQLPSLRTGLLALKSGMGNS